MFQKPLDGEIGFETTRFSHGGFRLVHFALKCVGGVGDQDRDELAGLDHSSGNPALSSSSNANCSSKFLVKRSANSLAYRQHTSFP